ncbi:ankyrin repeat domain-containing protein 62-like [Montipora capricornis]|uniref:ankyrin repeat domain-containing protein 62-like n=1 Tax=Montipora capricornis TaxID=246305 RepID=UPI0035F160F1
MRSHHSVADILLYREDYLTHKCTERQTSQLLRAFEKGEPFIADRILSKGALLSCRDRAGRTPLMIYLRKGGNWLVLNRHDVGITIECGKPFNSSEFHLAAFTKPTIQSDNFLLKPHFCDESHSFSEDGPLAKAIKTHPLGFRVINECCDAEGYTALHRAAQGGNLLFLKKFLSWGADSNPLTPQRHTALTLAILSGINPVFSSHKRNNAEKVTALLLRAASKITRFDVGCNRSNAKLTAYHLAAYAGLSGFVKILLKNERVRGINVNCSNVHGITPLYLANLNIAEKTTSDDKNNPWQEIADLIENHGGVLMYPNREVELNLLYKHLFGSFSDPFRLEISAKSELFYERDASHCRDSDLDHYNTGAMINPYENAVQRELLQIIKSLGGASQNVQLIPRESPQLQRYLEINLKAERAISELSQLFKDLRNGGARHKMVVTQRRNNARVPNTTAVEIPKAFNSRSNLKQRFLSWANRSERQKHLLSELLFEHDSSNALLTHQNKYLKEILHKYSEVFRDTKEMFELLEKYEESNLCKDEIFEAKMISLQFRTYVLRSQTNDFFSFLRTPLLSESTFTSKRTPSEWLTSGEPQRKITWNQAIKFLYQQGTQRYDPTFDYLQVLTLGRDKDTRIPLSVDALFSS